MIDRIKAILQDYIDVDGLDITPASTISSDIGLSSLDYFDFIGQLQDEFGVEIPDKELLGLRTVGDLIAAIESRLS